MDSIETYLTKKSISCRPDTIISTRRVLNKLNNFKTLSNINEKDLIKFFSEFKGANSSKNLFIVTIKKFFKDQEKEEIVKFLKPVKLQDELKENEILTTEDVNKLIETTSNHYFKALMAFLYESGCRIGEAHALRYKDFVLTTDGYIVEIQSRKTSGKSRKLILPFSTRYLSNLKLYTNAEDNDFVFNFDKGYERVRLTEIGKQAHIGKPVHPHAFRHGGATNDARYGWTEQQLKKKYGWTNGSPMADRYTHLTDEDIRNKQIESSGKTEIIKKTPERIVEAQHMKLHEAASRLFELEEENARLNQDIGAMQFQHEKDLEAMKAEMEQLKQFIHDPAMILAVAEGLKNKTQDVKKKV